MANKLNGRPPRIKDIKRAQELRRKGLSLMEISKLVLNREDKTTIHRWLKVNVRKSYPQL